tara:strand:+ start:3968 stop:5212 length:1245 start_codon:yes stop_codon:yes gene_type:complete
MDSEWTGSILAWLLARRLAAHQDSPPMRTTLPAFFALTFLLLGCSGGDAPQDSNGADEAGRARLVFLDPEVPERPYFRDLGSVPHGTRHTLDYKMLNAGQRDITVRRIDPACACSRISRIGYQAADGTWISGNTSGEGDVIRVPGGAELEFTIAVDTALLKPNQDKLEMVRFFTDASSVEERNTRGGLFDLEFHILSEKLFQLTPGHLSLGDIPQGAGGGSQLTIQTGQPLLPCRVIGVIDHPPELEVDLAVNDIRAETMWHLAVSLPAGLPRGAWTGTITLSTTDRNGEGNEGRLHVPVNAQVVQDVRIVPQILNMGLIQAGNVGTLAAEMHVLVPGQRVKILAAEITGDSAEHLTISYAPLRADPEGRDMLWTLKIACAADAPKGALNAIVELTLDDEVTPNIAARVQGAVR